MSDCDAKEDPQVGKDRYVHRHGLGCAFQDFREKGEYDANTGSIIEDVSADNQRGASCAHSHVQDESLRLVHIQAAEYHCGHNP